MELKRLTIETELNNYLVPTLPLTLRKLDRNVHVVMDIAKFAITDALTIPSKNSKN